VTWIPSLEEYTTNSLKGVRYCRGAYQSTFLSKLAEGHVPGKEPACHAEAFVLSRCAKRTEQI
jgi:hypothetical protein